MPQLSPFLGVFYDSAGNLISLSTGQPVLLHNMPHGMSPFNGVFYDENGELHDLTELSKPGGGEPVVFSTARPTGNWTLWLKDEGEIPDYPEPEDPVETVLFDTAPLDAPGDYAVMFDETDGETVLNMTDNLETAGDDDIIIV